VFRLLDTGSVSVAAGYALASTVGGLSAAAFGDRLGSAGR
jgi:fluoride ion exporter CrcB/FEX